MWQPMTLAFLAGTSCRKTPAMFVVPPLGAWGLKAVLQTWALGLFGDEGFASVGVAGPADLADPSVAASRRAVLSAVEDDL